MAAEQSRAMANSFSLDRPEAKLGRIASTP
jgi:hypothetical protein